MALSDEKDKAQPRTAGPTVSIITPVYNNVTTLEQTIRSVLTQTYPTIEYIIVDGASNDGTPGVAQQYLDRLAHFVSEPDEGMYDAINKGVLLATGEIVGIINADDFYVDDEVIQSVVAAFEEHGVDAVIADIEFVSATDETRVIRKYSPSRFTPEALADGFMPPHPGFFVRRSAYQKYGLYKTGYVIAADYELIVRFLLVNRLSFRYLPKTIVRMRQGGVSNSSLRSYWTLNKEVLRACRENDVDTNLFRILKKYRVKVRELRFRRASKSPVSRGVGHE